MSEHILVTGGAGFIGTALINHLNEHHYTTSSFDKNPTSSVTGYSIQRDLLTPSAFEVELELLNRKKRVDRVIHLAAQVGRLFGEDDIRHTVRSNAEMSTIVAAACGKMEIPLVYTSTSEVYGDQGETVCDEDEGPFSLPHNLYGLTKRWGEEAAQLYAPWDLIIWRPSMPYGPGAPPGRGRRAMDNFIWQAQHGMKIPVHKGAERSWCYIGDTVAAMRLTIEANRWAQTSSIAQDHLPQAYNIGRDDDPRSMLEIARMACDLAGASYDLIDEIDPPQAQTVVKKLSTEKIRKLGWEPKIDLEIGMKQVADWISNFDAKGNRQ
jgi:nucleoside-diphosphate-sugar epimerase